MYGTELGELEQLMMLVPNFVPRKNGMVVMKNYEKEVISVNCEVCDCLVSQFQSDILSTGNKERFFTEMMDYKSIVKNCFKNYGSIHLVKRIEYLIRNDAGLIFVSKDHRSRFYAVCRLQGVNVKDRNSFYLATLFLLTADDKLWRASKDHIYLESFDFKGMHLTGINTDGYALYQMARTICMGVFCKYFLQKVAS
jgi:hypothetical protein